MELIWCPPGSFIRGANNEKHFVILTKGFYLGKYEVTQEEHKKIMGNNPSNFKGAKLPVEMVSWNDAVAFCETLNAKERIPQNWKFTLPSDAEWEYACRAGTTTLYSWGNSINASLTNYNGSGLNKTVVVGSYQPNRWGFFDLHGNVGEWCIDLFKQNLPLDIQLDPVVFPVNGLNRVGRGGAWNSPENILRSGNRTRALKSNRHFYRGFRLCLAPAR